MRRKEKIDVTKIAAQDFINIESISDGILYSNTGYLFAYISVRAGDNHLLNEDELIAKVSNLSHAMSMSDGEPFQILAVPRTVDTGGMLEMLSEARRETQNDAKLKLLNGEIGSLQEMTREGAKEPMIVLKFWIKASKGADLLIKKRQRDLLGRLTECSVPADCMDDTDITYFCKMFSDLTDFHSLEGELYEDIPIGTGKKRLFTRNTDGDAESTLLRNLLAPVGGLKFGLNTVRMGNVVGRMMGVMKYPSELDYGWCVDLINNSDCITSITYYPGNIHEMGNALSQSINRNQADANSMRDTRLRKRHERQAIDADQLIDEMDYKNAAIGHISIIVMPFTSKEENLEDICRLAISRFSRKKMKLKTLASVQQEGFKAMSPYHTPEPLIDAITKQIIPLETLMAGSPLTVNIYRDNRGSYFARTVDGSIISLDLRYRGGDRTNGNLVVTGEAGQGKSTALKHIMFNDFMHGAKILVIDPEREYRDTCEKLGGTWLDVGGGSAKINPLQIRPVPEDDEESNEETALYRAKDNALALHIHTLDVFFSLYLPSLKDVQKALLKKELIALYTAHNITWETDVSALSATDFPLIEHLYEQMAQKEGLKDLALLIYDMAYGATSFLWNGYTNVDTSNDFIVLDTHRLANISDNIKRAQYFNNLSLCWEIISSNRNEPIVLLCDETHILLDPAIPQTAMLIRNISKRIRKYEGALYTAFQSVDDMLFDEIRIYGQAILDNATYKLIFGCDGRNLQSTADVFQLTKREQHILLARAKTHALFLMGRQHVQVVFEIPQYKLDLMGKGGGR